MIRKQNTSSRWFWPAVALVVPLAWAAHLMPHDHHAAHHAVPAHSDHHHHHEHAPDQHTHGLGVHVHHYFAKTSKRMSDPGLILGNPVAVIDHDPENRPCEWSLTFDPEAVVPPPDPRLSAPRAPPALG